MGIREDHRNRLERERTEAELERDRELAEAEHVRQMEEEFETKKADAEEKIKNYQARCAEILFQTLNNGTLVESVERVKMRQDFRDYGDLDTSPYAKARDILLEDDAGFMLRETASFVLEETDASKVNLNVHRYREGLLVQNWDHPSLRPDHLRTVYVVELTSTEADRTVSSSYATHFKAQRQTPKNDYVIDYGVGNHDIKLLKWHAEDVDRVLEPMPDFIELLDQVSEAQV